MQLVLESDSVFYFDVSKRKIHNSSYSEQRQLVPYNNSNTMNSHESTNTHKAISFSLFKVFPLHLAPRGRMDPPPPRRCTSTKIQTRFSDFKSAVSSRVTYTSVANFSRGHPRAGTHQPALKSTPRIFPFPPNSAQNNREKTKNQKDERKKKRAIFSHSPSALQSLPSFCSL